MTWIRFVLMLYFIMVAHKAACLHRLQEMSYLFCVTQDICPVGTPMDHHYHHQSLNREGSWGTTDDFATSFLHFSCSPLPSGTCPVHSQMLSSHLFLFPPCLLLPFTVPCKMVLARPDERETWPYHCSLHLFKIIRRSSCGPIACWFLAQISSLVTWSLYEMCSILR